MSRRRNDPPTPCGKRKLSQSRAQGVIKKARRSGCEHRQECRVYFCPGCQAWHTSSRPELTYEQRQAFRQSQFLS